MSHQFDVSEFEVEIASKGLSEEENIGYIVTGGRQYGLYIAEFTVNGDYNCHGDLVREYAAGKWEKVENIGSVHFQYRRVEITPDEFRSKKSIDDIASFEERLKWEESILESIEAIPNMELTVEDANWIQTD